MVPGRCALRSLKVWSEEVEEGEESGRLEKEGDGSGPVGFKGAGDTACGGPHQSASVAVAHLRDSPSVSGSRPAGPHTLPWTYPASLPGWRFQVLLSFAAASPTPSPFS